MINLKVSISPFYGVEITFSAPSSFEIAMSNLILPTKICMDIVLCYFVLLELTI